MRKFLVVALSGASAGLVLGLWVGSVATRSLPGPEGDGPSRTQYQGRETGFWLRQLKDSDPIYRQEAIQALEKIGPGESSVVPALAGMLKDRVALVRVGAANALRAIGPEARPILPSLLAALSDDNQFVRANAIATLGKIGPENEAVQAALIKATKDESIPVRRLALGALGAMGPGAKGFLPAVR